MSEEIFDDLIMMDNFYQIVDLYELYEDLCPKKISGKRILGFREFIHMVGAIDDLSLYLNHVLHLQHVSIIRNLKLWILYLAHKKIMGKENNHDKN